MAPPQVAMPAAVHTQIPPNVLVQRSTLETQHPPDDSPFLTVDAFVRHRARTNPHATIVSYPSSGIDFVDYSMQQLDVFAYRTARHYQSCIPTRDSSSTKPTTVALLGPSNLEYMVTMFALTKLGHTVLFLSTRISQLAIESLIKTTGATYLLADSKFLNTAEKVKLNLPHLHIHEIAGRTVFEFPIEVHADTRMDYQLDANVESLNRVYIVHSSGSTGLPKPIYQPHRNAIANYSVSMNMEAFITLPLYHNHGICNLFRAIYSGKSIHLYNADLPLTQHYLTSILQKHKFEIFYGVPYALKLLAETDEGIELLRQLKVVMYGGSPCPDALGDLLVERGVNLVSHYGATEVGQLMTSFRPANDPVWNYVREHEQLKPYLKWVPQGPNLFECTITDGWPAKVTSNQPDGSYATKDLFEPHPTIPAAWKYIARLDDTIVLVNGEKFNPVMMEGVIRSHKAVTETVVFGNGRPQLGVLIIPSPAVDGLSEEVIVDRVIPVIEEANRTAEAYARVSRDMIKVLPHGCEFPRTDKGSIIRQAFYRQFAKEIDDIYDEVATTSGDLQPFPLPDMERFIRTTLTKSIPEAANVENHEDFFSLGVDSLQSIQMRTEILKTVDIGGNKLGQNVVFEYPSIAALSAHLIGLRTGNTDLKTAVEDDMQNLIEKYGGFTPRLQSHSVVVTGATGSLGAHVVAQLSSRPDVTRIYCLVRASSLEDASHRIQKSLLQRRIYHILPLDARSKVIGLPCDLSDPHLGLSDVIYSDVAKNLRSVIHCAWSVNFNLGLSSFEKDCIAGVRHLLDLCHAVSGPTPASFDFCSSVSTVSRCPIPEAPETLPELSWAQGMGYAQSKQVAENLCIKAAQTTGIRARVLRVGQIVADTVHGVWNATEGIPLMMQTALTVGALPRISETPSWTPVDIVAKAVVEISFSDAGAIVANVTNAKTFRWTEDLLPALRNSGLRFDEVEPKEWVRRLRTSSQDPVLNPPIKLVEFFASKYDKETFPVNKRTFETTTARKFSPSLDNAPVLNQELVTKFVQRFLASAWKSSLPVELEDKTTKKQVIVIAGPCGSGKTTVAKALIHKLNAAFIEADELHTADSVSRMASGSSLTESDRIPWLERIRERARYTLRELGFAKVIIACSALRKSYRDEFRQLNDAGTEVLFVDLQCNKEELARRMTERKGHYMSPELLESQIADHEVSGVDEVDFLPVDAGFEADKVADEVEQLLDTYAKVGV
ncbi:male sterility protein [Pleomassaria siparia CBS 279.74]|uniref:gluconokinase n=1 Tax=Pleomassaria siparia CBS 279.74 TaxID=1314801 RepID=A0A6G1JW68_9PLEO|nr:male sterility protein [Pleomassaria siparia CBS 279.74]